MRPGRFSCNWERKNGAVMMMSREVHAFTGACFYVLSLFSRRVAACTPAHGLQTATGHNSFNTHSVNFFNVCSWQMRSTADCWLDGCGTQLCMIHFYQGDLQELIARIYEALESLTTLMCTFGGKKWKYSHNGQHVYLQLKFKAMDCNFKT